MSIFIDTSVLVAAIVATEEHHLACSRLLDHGDVHLYSHGLAEAFSTLTGGRRSFRMPALMAVSVIKEDYLPCLNLTCLHPIEILQAMQEADSRGIRGGAIFDYLHIAAARKAKATTFYTLNSSNFRAFHRSGDPEIVQP